MYSRVQRRMESMINQVLSELEGIVPGLHHISIRITEEEGFGESMAAEMNRIMEEILADDAPDGGEDVDDLLLDED